MHVDLEKGLATVHVEAASQIDAFNAMVSHPHSGLLRVQCAASRAETCVLNPVLWLQPAMVDVVSGLGFGAEPHFGDA